MLDTIEFPVITYAIFAFIVITGIIIDLYSHKSDAVITVRDAGLWSIFWVALSVVFGIYLYFAHGSEMSSLFFSGYILEKALSVDNLFVFMAIFGVAGFSIPENLRHRVLYWGIIGAIVFRMIFVFIGTSLFALSGWVEVIFGLIVGYTAYLLLVKNEEEEEVVDYTEHFAYRWTSKLIPVLPFLHGNKFFHRSKLDGILSATPLFLCLVIVEISDIMFAFDSVPAVIAVSREPLIVYSAMIFAILGLRTMYFLLEALKKYFIYLEKAVIGILFFIAAKLIINPLDHAYDIGYNINNSTSLMVIASLLTGSILLSIMKNRNLI
jgi:tellurite resistance protein TerC